MHDVFFFTDIHGMYPLYKAIMDYCLEQDPECSIIYGGDAIDRGKDGYKIMTELLDNPQVLYLMGNHEDMFTKAARKIKECFHLEGQPREEVQETLYWCQSYDYKYEPIRLSLYNGGLATLTDWATAGMSMDIVERIEHLPYTFSYYDYDFCHSAGVYNTFKRVADAEYDGNKPDDYDIEALLWSRSSLDIGWESDRTAVFGHTPVIYLPEYTDLDFPKEMKPQPVKYVSDKIPRFSGAKLDMDVCSIATKRAFVLNAVTKCIQGFAIENGQVKKIDYIQA